MWLENKIESAKHVYRNHSFSNYIKKEKKRGRTFASVDGTNETYIFDIDDEVIEKKMWTLTKTYANDEIEKFVELSERYYGIKPIKGLFLDIGANIGTTSCYVSKKYRGLRVIAFEPDPTNYKYLNINMLLNDCNSMVIENLGVSDRNEIKKMTIYPHNRGRNTLSEFTPIESTDDCFEIDITTIKIDDYIKERGINPDEINYIWIDAEGFEPQIFSGMSEILSKKKVPIFTEFSSSLMNEDMFNKMYNVIRNVYSECIVFSMSSDSTNVMSITELPHLYNVTRGGDVQYNLFLK